MKKILLALVFGFFTHAASAQIHEVDSLNQLLATTKEDTVKVMVLAKLSFYDQNFESALKSAQEGLEIARNIEYTRGEAQCLHQLGNCFWSISNYPLALHYYLEALKIRESIGDLSGVARSLNNIGMIYKLQGDYKSALPYFLKTEVIMRQINDYYGMANVMTDMGNVYESLNRLDSALMHYQRSSEYFDLTQDKYQLVNTLNGLGSVQSKKGNTGLALEYYRMAIPNAIIYNDTIGLSATYLQMATLFKTIGRIDSSIFYAQQALSLAQSRLVQPVIIDAGKLLSELYQNKNDKEAVRYLQIAMAAKDSTFSADKATQIQNLYYSEQERQRKISEAKAKEEKKQMYNLQFVLIAVGLISFLILFLLFSRTIIVNARLINFFGIIGLLMMFEFVNLFMHPYLVHITGDSPLLMLLVMVCVAALLVPLHHYLQKWVSYKLVEKNKKIRLAAAKKTIEKLEGQQKNNTHS